tara:strand:- start:24 stop:557 length:534 start_codon:yes stop_codon:yes gene_type:complete
MSNLRLLNETTVSSAVSTLEVQNIFSSDFDIYKITFTNFHTDENTYWDIRYINSSGSVISSSNYDYAQLNVRSNVSFDQFRNTNDTSIERILPYMSDDTNGNSNAIVYCFNPFSSSSYTFNIHQASNFEATNINANPKSIGVLKETVSITGFQLLATYATGTLDSGIVRSYGIRVDT